jgi:hypothetical protein
MTITSLREWRGHRRFVVLTTVTLIAVSLMAAGQKPADAAASRITGVEIVTRFTSPHSQSVQSVEAPCPQGKQIVGGGASAIEYDAAGLSLIPRRVTLTRLAPVGGSGQNRYAVTATETAPGTDNDWRVKAWAVCADPVPGHLIVSKATSFSSSAVQTADPVCPSGKSALGSGAMIHFPPDQPDQPKQGVGLQAARADALGVLTRTQAQEQPAGYPHNWQLVGFAICANTPQGFEVVGDASDEQDSETVKEARVKCPGGKQMLGVGGAITAERRPDGTYVAPGNVTLTWIIPGVDGLVIAVENTPTSVDWDFIVVRAICVDR